MILIKQSLKNKILQYIFLLLCIGCTNEQDIEKYKITNIVPKLQSLTVPQCKNNRFTDIAGNFYLMASLLQNTHRTEKCSDDVNNG